MEYYYIIVCFVNSMRQQIVRKQLWHTVVVFHPWAANLNIMYCMYSACSDNGYNKKGNLLANIQSVT